MARADLTVRLSSQLVVRGSDGVTLLLIEGHVGDPDRPLIAMVIDTSIEDDR